MFQEIIIYIQAYFLARKRSNCSATGSSYFILISQKWIRQKKWNSIKRFDAIRRSMLSIASTFNSLVSWIAWIQYFNVKFNFFWELFLCMAKTEVYNNMYAWQEETYDFKAMLKKSHALKIATHFILKYSDHIANSISCKCNFDVKTYFKKKAWQIC